MTILHLPFMHNLPMTSATASTIFGGSCAGVHMPMLRSPRNDARPRIAFIGIVFSAAGERRPSAEPDFPRRPSRTIPAQHGRNTSSIGSGHSDLPRPLTAESMAAAANALPPPVPGLTSSASDLPSDRRGCRKATRTRRPPSSTNVCRRFSGFAKAPGGKITPPPPARPRSRGAYCAVIAVANGTVEISQLVRAGNAAVGDGHNQTFARILIDQSCERPVGRDSISGTDRNRAGAMNYKRDLVARLQLLSRIGKGDSE